ncbi:MAG: quinolinate synthase [archaeon]
MALNTDEIKKKLLAQHYSVQEIDAMLPQLLRILALKEQKKAILLAHYYQIPAIQAIADFVGDSLNLALKAKELQGKGLVISSTVHFMAEMITLLSPEKKVIIPDPAAGCSIAEGMNPETVEAIRKHYPAAGIVAYINTTAAVKAAVDVVCTSANAAAIIATLPGDPIILLPDYYFGKNILSTVKDASRAYLNYKGMEDGNIVLEGKDGSIIRIPHHFPPMLPKGTCIVHEKFTEYDILEYKETGQVDVVIAHPEVRPEVAKFADMIGGTGKMISFLRDNPAKKILFITECDMSAPLREAYPDKEFFTPCRLCPYMKKNTLDALEHALQTEQVEVIVPAETVEKARRSIEYMFELTMQ